MFERFTDRARRVVVLAQEEARRLNHSYIGTEHILLGLLAEEQGLGAQALVAMGTDLDSVRAAVADTIGVGRSAPSGQIPFTPRSKRVLELTLREALQLGHNYLGTEHILLGLLREGEGAACQVLTRLGVSLEATRRKVAELVGVEPELVDRPLPEPRRGYRCKHPDESLRITSAVGLRAVRCITCGELVGVLPESSSEAS